MAVVPAVEEEKGLPKRVRLYNRGTVTYDQWVRGEHYVIEPGEFKEMARRTAITVKGFYCKPKDDRQNDIPVCLDWEPIEESGREDAVVQVADKVYACPRCEADFGSKEEFETHYDLSHRPGPKKGAKSDTSGSADNN